MSQAIISFDVEPGMIYVILYKQSINSTWINPPGNPTSISPFIINGLLPDTQYDFKIDTECGSVTTQKRSDCPSITNLIAQNI